jgi:hypothetical protein
VPELAMSMIHICYVQFTHLMGDLMSKVQTTILQIVKGSVAANTPKHSTPEKEHHWAFPN